MRSAFESRCSNVILVTKSRILFAPPHSAAARNEAARGKIGHTTLYQIYETAPNDGGFRSRSMQTIRKVQVLEHVRIRGYQPQG